MDKIKISDLEVFANHGVYEEEIALGQKFLVDAELFMDLQKAGLSDKLRDSVHYGDICHDIVKHMQEHTYRLLEAACENIAHQLLVDYPMIDAIRLEIKKPWAPIALPLKTVSVEIERGWHDVYLSIGSNLENKKEHIEDALDKLRALDEVKGLEVSKLVETAPYGKTDQPPFLNGAIYLKTLDTPLGLLDRLHKVELSEGRKREERWGPRTLDLDIIFYDDEIINEPDLIIPHMDMHNRLFVLEPLLELCPSKMHPIFRKTVRQMYEELRQKA